VEEKFGWLRIRCPTPLIVLADEHARRQDMTLAAFTRAALTLLLQAEGARPPRLPEPRARSASLYYGIRPGARQAHDGEVTA
jgi:hypothetical protein